MSVRAENVDGNYVCSMPALNFTIFGARRDGDTLYVKKGFRIAFVTTSDVHCVNTTTKIGGRDPISCCATPRDFAVRQVLMDPLSALDLFGQGPNDGEEVWMSLVGCDRAPKTAPQYRGKAFCKFKLVYEE